MKTDEKQQELISPNALYSYAMIELDSNMKLFNELENNIKTQTQELDIIISAGRNIPGIETYINELLHESFFPVKDRIYLVRKQYRKFRTRLEELFMQDDSKERFFNAKVLELEQILANKERFIDNIIQICTDFIDEKQNSAIV